MPEKAATYPVGMISRLLVLTDRQVQSLAAQGVLPKSERGRYELVPVVQAYIRYLRERTLGTEVGADEIGKLKARVISARARMAEAEADQVEGALLPRAAVEAAWIQVAGTMRAKLLGVPARCASVAHAATSVAEASAVIAGAVNDALEEISSTPVYAISPPGNRGAGDADEDGSSGAADDDAAAELEGVGVG